MAEVKRTFELVEDTQLFAATELGETLKMRPSADLIVISESEARPTLMVESSLITADSACEPLVITKLVPLGKDKLVSALKVRVAAMAVGDKIKARENITNPGIIKHIFLIGMLS